MAAGDVWIAVDWGTAIHRAPCGRDRDMRRHSPRVGGGSRVSGRDMIAAWRAAGGFGLGSNLYRPGKSADAVMHDAVRFILTIKELA